MAGTRPLLKKGDVLELSDVYAVNPVTKATLPFKKQFVVKEDTVTASGDTAILISPPIITSGPFQTVSNAPTDGTTTITKVATGGTGYRQNMVFHKNAFALAMVPKEKPAGAVEVARKTYKGSQRSRIDPELPRRRERHLQRSGLDILFGVKTESTVRFSQPASAAPRLRGRRPLCLTSDNRFVYSLRAQDLAGRPEL